MRPTLRPDRRVFALALLAGAVIHLAIVALGARLRPSPAALPTVERPSFGELLLVPGVSDEPSAPAEPGGGSNDPGNAERAEGRHPPASKPRPVAAADVASRPARPAPPRAADAPPEPSIERGEADSLPDDLLALDELLSSDVAQDVAPVRIKPKPIWRSTLTRSPATLGSMSGRHPARSARVGSGPGRGGGPGGSGRGEGAGSSAQKNPFGGDRGAFTGSVCFLAPFTDSIKAIGRCTAKLVLHTDHFDIPTTNFVGGFPGVPRDEWFAILYEGRFSVARSGEYAFRLASDDGSILEIDGERVIDNDGLHGPLAKRGRMVLQAGTHQLALRYFQGPRQWVALQLWVTPPGGEEQLFGPSF